MTTCQEVETMAATWETVLDGADVARSGSSYPLGCVTSRWEMGSHRVCSVV